MARATTTIVCPGCGHSFSLSDAVRAEIDGTDSDRSPESSITRPQAHLPSTFTNWLWADNRTCC
jgi:hypothetical protein